MARISAIKFNGSNAYELGANESATSWPQGVQGASQVSVGVELYATTSGSGVTLRLRAIGTSGALLTEINQPYTIPTLNIWQRAESTFDLPAGTDKAELRIIANGGTVLFAQPKLVTGNEPGAYNSVRSPQLTMLTATGIYTGTVSAQQVVLTDGTGLGERLTTINADMIQLEDTVTGKTSRLTADMIQLENTVTGKTSRLTADGLYTAEVQAGQVKTGRLESTNGFSWISLDDGAFSFGDGALTWTGGVLDLRGRLTSRFSASKPTSVEIDNGQIRFVNDLGTLVGLINNNNASVLEGLNITTGLNSKYMSFGHLLGNGLTIDYYINLGENPGGMTEKHIFVGDARVRGEARIQGSLNVEGGLNVDLSLNVGGSLDVEGSLNAGRTISAPHLQSNIVLDSLGNERMSFNESGNLYIRNRSGKAVLWVSDAGNFAQLLLPSNTDHAIGVDETGAYKITSGVKTYL